MMNKVRSLLPNWRPVMQVSLRFCSCNMGKNLVSFPVINIGEGKQKYVLAKVYEHGDMNGAKMVIRAVGRVKYHLDIYDQLQKEANTLDLCTQCLGGGIMIHDSNQQYIKLYGRSQTLGKADHNETRDLLCEKYTEYKIDAEPGDMDI